MWQKTILFCLLFINIVLTAHKISNIANERNPHYKYCIKLLIKNQYPCILTRFKIVGLVLELLFGHERKLQIFFNYVLNMKVFKRYMTNCIKFESECSVQ